MKIRHGKTLTQAQVDAILMSEMPICISAVTERSLFLMPAI